jgi:hypothetical protein
MEQIAEGNRMSMIPTEDRVFYQDLAAEEKRRKEANRRPEVLAEFERLSAAIDARLELLLLDGKAAMQADPELGWLYTALDALTGITPIEERTDLNLNLSYEPNLAPVKTEIMPAVRAQIVEALGVGMERLRFNPQSSSLLMQRIFPVQSWHVCLVMVIERHTGGRPAEVNARVCRTKAGAKRAMAEYMRLRAAYLVEMGVTDPADIAGRPVQ